MMRLLYIPIIFIFSALFMAEISLSEDIDPTPIDPDIIKKPEEMGLIIGIGGNTQSGSFFSSCPCEFMKGSGVNFLGGVFYEKEIFDDFRIGISGLFSLKSLESSYNEKETMRVYSLSGSYVADANISSEHTGSLNFISIGAEPFFKWYFGEIVFIKTGFDFSYNVSSTIKHAQNFLQQSVKLSNGEIGIIKDSDGRLITKEEIILEDRNFSESSPFQFGIAPMFGIDIQINQSIAITPIFQYYLPLTTISDKGAGFKINSWAFLFELRHTLLKVSAESDKTE